MGISPRSSLVPIESLKVAAYKIPTDYPEADGTIAWGSTTIVVVEPTAGGKTGLGYSYADTATFRFVHDVLEPVVVGKDAFATNEVWESMAKAVRNHGRPGVASMAISAVDNAVWDLKAKLLDLSVARLLGPVREGITVYGSGGFTSYPVPVLQKQLAGWVSEGIGQVKMKVGTHPDEDPKRVRAARDAIGPDAGLFVDANGAYTRKQAIHFAELFAELNVGWFEEPVSSDDLSGLRLIRDRAPSCMNITAGEYGYDLHYFRRMLEAGAVDVLQADGTRCGGITGFMHASAVCESFGLPFSAHTAPSIHAHACCASIPAINLEYFHDHVRIEHMLFNGTLSPRKGVLYPDPDRPGFGLELRRKDADRYAIT